MSRDSSREFFVIPETITLEGEVCSKRKALDDVKISKDTGCEAGGRGTRITVSSKRAGL